MDPALKYDLTTLLINQLIAEYLGLFYNFDTKEFTVEDDANDYVAKGPEGERFAAFNMVGTTSYLVDESGKLDLLNTLKNDPLELLYATLGSARKLNTDHELQSILFSKFNKDISDVNDFNDFEAVVKLENGKEPTLSNSDEARKLLNVNDLTPRYKIYRERSKTEGSKVIFEVMDGIWYFADISPANDPKVALKPLTSRIYLVTNMSKWYATNAEKIRSIGVEYLAEEDRRREEKLKPKIVEKPSLMGRKIKKVDTSTNKPSTNKTGTGSMVMPSRTATQVLQEERSPSAKRPSTAFAQPVKEVSKEELEQKAALNDLANKAVASIVQNLSKLREKKKTQILKNIQNAVYKIENQAEFKVFKTDAKPEKNVFNITTGNNALGKQNQAGKIYTQIDAEFITGLKNTWIRLVLDTGEFKGLMEFISPPRSGNRSNSRSDSAQKSSFIREEVIPRAFKQFYLESDFGDSIVQNISDNSLDERLDMLDNLNQNEEVDEGTVKFATSRGKNIGFLPEMIMFLPDLPTFELNNIGGELPKIEKTRSDLVAEKARKLQANSKVTNMEIKIKELQSLREQCGGTLNILDKVRSTMLNVEKAELDIQDSDKEFILNIPKDENRQYLNVDIKGKNSETKILEDAEQSEDEEE